MGLGPDDQLGQENGPSVGGPNHREQAARARESAERWIGQLQDMIDQAGRQAAPLLRDVAAKAAELAAVAAEHAGPAAHKAANVTEHVGDRLAARSKNLAADLRKAAEAARTQPAPSDETADAPMNGESKPDDGDQA